MSYIRAFHGSDGIINHSLWPHVASGYIYIYCTSTPKLTQVTILVIDHLYVLDNDVISY